MKRYVVYGRDFNKPSKKLNQFIVRYVDTISQAKKEVIRAKNYDKKNHFSNYDYVIKDTSKGKPYKIVWN